MNRQKAAILLIVSIACGARLSGQTAGNPLGAAGQSQVTMSLAGAYQTVEHGDQEAVSRRLLLRAQYGLTRPVDVYGMVGTVQVQMKNRAPGISDYKDESRIAYGAGFSAGAVRRPAAAPRGRRPAPRAVSFWAGGHVLRFPAEAVYNQALTVLTYRLTREHRLRYDCMEAAGFAGLALPAGAVNLYAGGAVWGITRRDRKEEWLLQPGTEPALIGRKTAVYRSGIWTGAVAGFEWRLPQSYTLTVEALGFNEKNYQITVGLSQTGLAAW